MGMKPGKNCVDVGIVVSNIEKSLAFYEGLLGLEKIGETPLWFGTMHRMGITELTHDDFDYLVQMNADPAAIIVREDAPWNTLPEWLEHIRSNPGQIKMSGTATGGVWDLARAGLLQTAGLNELADDRCFHSLGSAQRFKLIPALWWD